MLKKVYNTTNLLEVGCDEAGRGCLAGPVTAACVAPLQLKEQKENVSTDYFLLINELNDSKQLNEKKRLLLKPLIELFSSSFAVTHIHNEEIDELNILNASMKAMQTSILALEIKPEYIIIDGNRPLNGKLGMKTNTGRNFTQEEIDYLKSIPNTSIIKGDSKYITIAAASVLAKTYRDLYMDKIHEEYPMYGWNKNKGYPTKEHRLAIEKYGITKYHRKTFRLLPEQLSLEL
jgi:ribonuclease HII